MSSIKIAIAQINFLVGNIAANAQHIIESAHQARELGADIVVFPELTITGYPAEDLLLRKDFIADANNAVYTLDDGLGRTLASTSPEGLTTLNIYDDVGNVVIVSQRLGYVSETVPGNAIVGSAVT